MRAFLVSVVVLASYTAWAGIAPLPDTPAVRLFTALMAVLDAGDAVPIQQLRVPTLRSGDRGGIGEGLLRVRPGRGVPPGGYGPFGLVLHRRRGGEPGHRLPVSRIGRRGMEDEPVLERPPWDPGRRRVLDVRRSPLVHERAVGISAVVEGNHRGAAGAESEGAVPGLWLRRGEGRGRTHRHRPRRWVPRGEHRPTRLPGERLDPACPGQPVFGYGEIVAAWEDRMARIDP